MKSDLSPDHEAVLALETDYWHLVQIGDVDAHFVFW